MHAYYRWVLHHRVAVLIICASLTLLAGLSLSRATMSTSLSKLFLEDTTDHQRYIERVTRYGGSEQLIIGVEQLDLKAPPVQTRLRRIVGQLEALDGVSRVTSIFSGLPAESRVDIDALAGDPMVGGLLLSADGRHMSIVAEFKPDDLQTLERAPAVIGQVMEVFENEGIGEESLHFGGFMAMVAEIARQGRRNLAWITPLVGVLLLMMVYLFFRRLWPVLLTALVAVLAIVWTMGFACLLDPEFNVLLALAPALILLISFSDVVHLCSAYARELAGGRDRDDAILRSAVDVGTACIMTSLTTFVGFVSLLLIEVAAFRRFGFILGFGTGVALILAMTLVPVVFSFMRPPRPWTHEDHRRPGRILDAVLAVCERVAVACPWKVIGGSVVLMVALALGCTRIRVEADFVGRMSKRNPLRIDTQYFNDHFAGTLAIELFLTAEDGSTIGPELFERMAVCRRVIEAHPEVTKVIPPFGATSNPRLAAPDLERFVDADRREVRLIALIRETGVSAIYRIGKKLQQDALTALGPGVVVEPSGFFYLAGRWLDHHIVTNKRAVLTAFAVIAVLLVVLFRSVRIGLWSLLPNVLPLLAVGGVLGIVWRTVDSDLVIILLLAMGIAVDDTIHFLSRWRIEIRRGASSAEALHRAFGYAGRAIVKTSVIFAVGFAPMAMSGYLPFRMMGILMPLAVITALLADLLLLPALVHVGAIRAPA